MAAAGNVRWFSDIRLHDVASVGGKNASLGELYSVLSGRGVRVPNGFVLTAQSYRDALSAAGAWDRLHRASRRGRQDPHRCTCQACRRSPRRLSSMPPAPIAFGRKSPRPINSSEVNMGPTLRLPYAARPRPRICRRRALQASTKASSTSAVRGSVRSLPALLRVHFHRSRHFLSNRQWVRPFQGRAVGRRDEDGASRPGFERCDLHTGYRVRLPRCRIHHRRLRAG